MQKNKGESTSLSCLLYIFVFYPIISLFSEKRQQPENPRKNGDFQAPPSAKNIRYLKR
jgi:hypothetical protein